MNKLSCIWAGSLQYFGMKESYAIQLCFLLASVVVAVLPNCPTDSMPNWASCLF